MKIQNWEYVRSASNRPWKRHPIRIFKNEIENLYKFQIEQLLLSDAENASLHKEHFLVLPEEEYNVFVSNYQDAIHYTNRGILITSDTEYDAVMNLIWPDNEGVYDPISSNEEDVIADPLTLEKVIDIIENSNDRYHTQWKDLDSSFLIQMMFGDLKEVDCNLLDNSIKTNGNSLPDDYEKYPFKVEIFKGKIGNKTSTELLAELKSKYSSVST